MSPVKERPIWDFLEKTGQGWLAPLSTHLNPLPGKMISGGVCSFEWITSSPPIKWHRWPQLPSRSSALLSLRMVHTPGTFYSVLYGLILKNILTWIMEENLFSSSSGYGWLKEWVCFEWTSADIISTLLHWVYCLSSWTGERDEPHWPELPPAPQPRSPTPPPQPSPC